MNILLFIFFIAPALHAAGDPAQGRELYLKSCAHCHGEAGNGKSPAAELMFVKPRDFTSGAYKIRTTPYGEIPTDADLYRSIAEGLPGSMMPSWKTVYNKEQISSLIAYIKTFSERFLSEKPSKVYAPPGGREASPAAIANGRKIYLELRCDYCHGPQGRGDGPSALHITDDAGNPLRPANFHQGWNLRGGHQASDILRAIMTGLNGTPMLSYRDVFDEDPAGAAKAWDLANYIRSLSTDKPPPGASPAAKSSDW